MTEKLTTELYQSIDPNYVEPYSADQLIERMRAEGPSPEIFASMIGQIISLQSALMPFAMIGLQAAQHRQAAASKVAGSISCSIMERTLYNAIDAIGKAACEANMARLYREAEDGDAAIRERDSQGATVQ